MHVVIRLLFSLGPGAVASLRVPLPFGAKLLYKGNGAFSEELVLGVE